MTLLTFLRPTTLNLFIYFFELITAKRAGGLNNTALDGALLGLIMSTSCQVYELSANLKKGVRVLTLQVKRHFGIMTCRD